ncbi:MAG: methyltransferase domain-containing protein [Candidatus Dormibacteraeota bacterium]|nr:methyltransferase domain-containing protein [Candidatus Dormibacteraeota bacterium]MBO0762398.1 methyltransferase domain-containing protein [Candidatus Dormibacteraeota bacterium]
MQTHRGWRYDLLVGLFDTVLHRGKVRELRRRTLALARIQPGQRVLDVGCGTGTLAIEAQRLAGASGRVCGVDPDERQVARARAKAARRRMPIEVWTGGVEHLDFPDATFDAVLSTMMLHHLPAGVVEQGLAEIARVLKPSGRLALADFSGLDLPALVRGAGLSPVESAELPFPAVPGSPAHQSGSMEFVAAVRPRDQQAAPVPGHS